MIRDSLSRWKLLLGSLLMPPCVLGGVWLAYTFATEAPRGSFEPLKVLAVGLMAAVAGIAWSLHLLFAREQAVVAPDRGVFLDVRRKPFGKTRSFRCSFQDLSAICLDRFTLRLWHEGKILREKAWGALWIQLSDGNTWPLGSGPERIAEDIGRELSRVMDVRLARIPSDESPVAEGQWAPHGFGTISDLNEE